MKNLRNVVSFEPTTHDFVSWLIAAAHEIENDAVALVYVLSGLEQLGVELEDLSTDHALYVVTLEHAALKLDRRQTVPPSLPSIDARISEENRDYAKDLSSITREIPIPYDC